MKEIKAEGFKTAEFKVTGNNPQKMARLIGELSEDTEGLGIYFNLSDSRLTITWDPEELKHAGGRPRAVTTWEQIGKMADSGLLQKEICAELGISRSTYCRRLKEYKEHIKEEEEKAAKAATEQAAAATAPEELVHRNAVLEKEIQAHNLPIRHVLMALRFYDESAFWKSVREKKLRLSQIETLRDMLHISTDEILRILNTPV